MEIFLLLGVFLIVMPAGAVMSVWLVIQWWRRRGEPAELAPAHASLETLWFRPEHDIELLCQKAQRR